MYFIAGGVESMSRAPYVLSKAGTAFARNAGDPRHLDRVAVHQPERSPSCTTPTRWVRRRRMSRGSMAISREDQDAFRSIGASRRWAELQTRTRRHCDDEIVARRACPQRKRRSGHRRYRRAPASADTTIEQLAKLRPVFAKDDGGDSVTAGNSSGVNDGAAALLIWSRSQRAEVELGLVAASRFVGHERRRPGSIRRTWVSARCPADPQGARCGQEDLAGRH